MPTLRHPAPAPSAKTPVVEVASPSKDRIVITYCVIGSNIPYIECYNGDHFLEHFRAEFSQDSDLLARHRGICYKADISLHQLLLRHHLRTGKVNCKVEGFPDWLLEEPILYQGVLTYRWHIDESDFEIIRGWVQLEGSHAPVSLSLEINERRSAKIVADEFRRDLLLANIGNGCHGFQISVAAYTQTQSNKDPIRVSVRIEETGESIEAFEIPVDQMAKSTPYRTLERPTISKLNTLRNYYIVD